jgi:hypothetical protein
VEKGDLFGEDSYDALISELNKRIATLGLSIVEYYDDFNEIFIKVERKNIYLQIGLDFFIKSFKGFALGLGDKDINDFSGFISNPKFSKRLTKADFESMRRRRIG